MNTARQLLRQPLRTAAVMLLLSMAGAFFCLSFGVYLSAQATGKQIESSFVTIALPTSKTERVEMDMGNGLTGFYEKSVITPETWEFINRLPETCPAVKGIYRQRFISAWSPSLSTLTSAQSEASYYWYLNEPYNNTVFVVTLTEIGAVDEDTIPGRPYVNLTATVEKTVLLHPGYAPRKTLQISCNFSSREEMEAANLAVGGRYLVYGKGYVDLELDLRTSLAQSCRCSTDEIDWNNISYDVAEFLQGLKEHNASGIEDIVALYKTENVSSSLTTNDINAIDAASLIVEDAGKHRSPDDFSYQVDGAVVTVPLAQLLSSPSITRLNTDLDTFLSSADGAEWADVIAQTKIRYQCAPIIGTDLLESMYLFEQRDAVLVGGRTFTQEDYQNGNAVCVISEPVALASGLKVGDRIDLSFYWGADPYSELEKNSNLMAQSYSNPVGFLGEGKSYEIVGIYRQSDLWEQFSYAFTPNTIFVPNASLPEPCYTGQTGVFLTIVLKNGGIEVVRSVIAAQGYAEDTLLYYDNGFTEIFDTLKGFFESAVQLFGAACITWVAALAAYLALFVYHQRAAAGLMLLMGAGKQKARWFVFGISMLPVVIASMISAVAGALLLTGTLQKVFTSAGDILSTSFSNASESGHAAIEATLVALPLASVAAAVLQILLYALSVWICAGKLAKKPPLMLLRREME
jgi:hypothetical protein